MRLSWVLRRSGRRRHFETVERLPGLTGTEAAYEAGRAPRMIGHTLDSQSSPVEHGQHFLAQLANAVLTFALRGERHERHSVNATNYQAAARLSSEDTQHEELLAAA